MRDDICSIQLFGRCTPRNALKLLWLVAHTSSLYFQQEKFILTNILQHLLPNWAIILDYWRVAQERELSKMISPRKIIYERSISCKPRIFRLYAPSPFVMVHFLNTSAVIDIICVSSRTNCMCLAGDRVKHVSFIVLTKELALRLISRVPQHATGSTPPL